jgi:hypothetical protein
MPYSDAEKWCSDGSLGDKRVDNSAQDHSCETTERASFASTLERGRRLMDSFQQLLSRAAENCP